MILIKHGGDAEWKTPATSSYADERALQELIARSPQLLPGASKLPMAVAREVGVPDTGRVDVVGVDTTGTITLVECKLRANPEIRRQIVGQALAYAAGLWGMSYEAFDLAFSAISSKPLVEQVRTLADSDWDEEAFRTAVAANLSKGCFRLIIAVDEITSELQRTVLYLNQHTNADTQVLALELRYIADRDVEILVPQTYGEESAQPKVAAARKRWTEERLFQQLSAECSTSGTTSAKQLYRWLIDRGGKLYWGDGTLGWVSAQFPVGGKLTALVSLGEWPQGRWVVSLNFEYVCGLIAPDTLRQAATILRRIPRAAKIYANLEAKEFRQRPNLPIDEFLVQPDAIDHIQTAIEVLIQAGAAPPQVVSSGDDETPEAVIGDQY